MVSALSPLLIIPIPSLIEWGGPYMRLCMLCKNAPCMSSTWPFSAGPRDFQMLMQAAVASLDGICTVTPPYNTYS